MKSQRHKAAFTIVELTVIVATIGLFAAMMLPALAAAGVKSQRIICANNLKETYLAFKTWEGENSDEFPMAVPIASGGAEPYIWSYQNDGSASTAGSPYPTGTSEPGGPWAVFQTVSNQLATPEILYCPSDNTPTVCMATSGNGNVSPTTHVNSYAKNFNAGTFSDAYVSYFICGEASDAYPKMVIFGDRNLSSIGVTANLPAAATGMMPAGTPPDSEKAFAYNTSAANWSWTAQDLHLGAGNLGLTDGSVSQVTVIGMRQAMILAANGLPTGATMCSYNFP
jgi:type II secretory pathway pseudopilin PulG